MSLFVEGEGATNTFGMSEAGSSVITAGDSGTPESVSADGEDKNG